MKPSDFIAIAIGIAIGFLPVVFIYVNWSNHDSFTTVSTHRQTVVDTFTVCGDNDRYRYHPGLNRLLCKIDKFIDWDTVHVR